MVTRWVTLSALVICAGCVDHKPYVCATSDQCVKDGVTGVCEPQGFCSFDDASCPGGRRFAEDAADGLGGSCVTPGCGAVGGACCAGAGETACADGAFCDGTNTCAACVVDMAGGREHGCAIRYDGTVWCFGANDVGQLGYGLVSDMPSAEARQVLEQATGLPIMDATAIGTGQDHTCVIRAGGAVWCWGANNQGQLADGAMVEQPAAVPATIASDSSPLVGMVEVSAGYCNTCARGEDGTVWCWGCNNNGELGDGTIMPRLRAAPVLTALGGEPLGGIASISVGGWGQACARTTADRGLCWGDGSSVGHGVTDDALVPVDVIDAVSIAAGMGHVCAAKADGSAWCWGSEDHSRIGNGTGDGWDGGVQLTPTPVLDSIGGAPISGIRSVAAGAVSCAVTTGGAALCWGDDKYGQAATLDNVKTPEPVQARAGGHLTGVDRIWAHYTRTCAKLVDGRVTCWGKNNLGQLGDGTFVNRGAPTTLAVSCP